MSNRNIISFSVDDVESLEEINESQFAKCRLRAFSDGITTHEYRFALDVLKSGGYTILGKPILWAYSPWYDDASGHESTEVPCGFVPKDIDDADITYEYDDELDKTFMYVNCYIWKVYAEKLIEILGRTNGIKDVSVEIWIIKKIEPPDKYTEVTEFSFTGITILGEDIPPACPGANIEVVKFSAEEFSKAKENFEKKLYNSKDQEQQCSFFYTQKTEKEENTLVNEESKNSVTEENPEVLENAKAVVRTSVNISQDTDLYDDDGGYMGNSYESHSKSTTAVEEVSDTPEVVDNSDTEKSDEKEMINNSKEDLDDSSDSSDEVESVECSVEDEHEALKANFSKLEKEHLTLKENYSALELKCSVLEEYKKNKEDDVKMQVIECALNDVANVLSPEEISTWRNKSLNCENVDHFKNELKAFAYDIQKNKGIEVKETLRNSIPNVIDNEPENIWDRLEKQTAI